MTVRAPLKPGKLSPPRKVPAAIERPEYVGRKEPRRTGTEIQDAETIERMRLAGRLAAQATVLAGEHCKPGVTTDEIDRVVHEFLCDHGAYPSTLGYRG
jgi:methionyl aminopeptidase